MTSLTIQVFKCVFIRRHCSEYKFIRTVKQGMYDTISLFKSTEQLYVEERELEIIDYRYCQLQK